MMHPAVNLHAVVSDILIPVGKYLSKLIYIKLIIQILLILFIDSVLDILLQQHRIRKGIIFVIFLLKALGYIAVQL